MPTDDPTIRTAGARPAPLTDTGPHNVVPRSRFHRLPTALVAGYLVAGSLTALGALAADAGFVPAPPVAPWLVLHLLLLGAATNAIFAWSLHFALALLRARARSVRGLWLRLAVLNIGVLTVLTGVVRSAGELAAVGAGMVAGAVAAHLGALLVLLRARAGAGLLGSLRGPLAGTVWFYVAAGVALLTGATIGALLTLGLPADPGWHERLHVAHGHVNLLGWVGLSVIGTEFALWPAVLGVRVATGVSRVARRVLFTASGGLVVAVVGMLLGWWPLAAVGLAGYAGGVALSLNPFVRTLPRHMPRNGPPWMLALAMVWLVVALLGDLYRLARSQDVLALAGGFGRLAPVLGFGFAAQTLLGALTFLLPVVLGGGPSGLRRLRAVLDRGWLVRAGFLNAGALLFALPVTGFVRSCAGGMVAVAVGSFAVLAVVALVRSRRRPGSPGPSPVTRVGGSAPNTA
ncbi:MAG TPA: hypothetical protein VIS06_13125 [Mycobacteriales bacterium]